MNGGRNHIEKKTNVFHSGVHWPGGYLLFGNVRVSAHPDAPDEPESAARDQQQHV